MAGFCRERGLCAPHFFAWKKRLSQVRPEPFVAVQVVEAAPAAASGAIEIRAGGVRSVLVEPGLDAAHLFRACARWTGRTTHASGWRAEATDMRCGFDRLAERQASGVECTLPS